VIVVVSLVFPTWSIINTFVAPKHQKEYHIFYQEFKFARFQPLLTRT
jgi:hypothetical protein